MGVKGVIKYSTFLVAVVLAITAMAVADETKLDVEPQKHLDRKGFFVLPQSRVEELKVKSVTTTDWLYLEDGKLKDRKRGVRAEYDVFGRLIGFAGHVDQKGYMEVENQYDDEGRLLEERIFSKEGDVLTLAVKIIYD